MQHTVPAMCTFWVVAANPVGRSFPAADPNLSTISVLLTPGNSWVSSDGLLSSVLGVSVRGKSD